MSPTGAEGLGQMTDIAVKEVQQTYGFNYTPDLFNPCENAVWSTLYLAYVFRHAHTTVEAMVMYHGGFRQLALYRQRLPIAGETDQYWRKVLKLKRDYDRTFARIPEPPSAREQWLAGILAGLQPGGSGTYLDLAGIESDAFDVASRALQICGSVGGPPRAEAIPRYSYYPGL